MTNINIEDYISELKLDKSINLEDIPEIDLYMDQVIQLFEAHYGDTVRNEDEKILTKTMINNYAKGKLLMSIKNKKYSKEHIILMNLIYTLKGSLSLTDIKMALDPIIQSYEKLESYPLRDVYQSILKSNKSNVELFSKEIPNIEENVKNLIDSDSNLGDYEEKLLLLISFISLSNMYRRMGEKIIDSYFNLNKEKK